MQRRTLLAGAAGAAGIAGTVGFGPAGAAPLSSDQPVQAAPSAEIVEKPVRIYGDDHCLVPHRRAMSPGAVRARMPHDFVPGRRLFLKAGTVRTPGGAALTCDVVLEENAALTMRDGTTIYTDVYRPADDERHPAIVAWSPYGKTVGGQILDDREFLADWYSQRAKRG